MTDWLTDIRKTAFLAAIGTMMGLLPIANPKFLNQQLAQFKGSLHDGPYVLPLFVVIALILTAIVAIPVGFLFALCRTKETLRVPDRLRVVAWATALAASIIYLIPWSKSPINPVRIAELKTPDAMLWFLISFGVEVVSILFLISLARQPAEVEEGPDSPHDRPLRLLAKAGTIIWVVILVGIVLATGITVFEYTSMKSQFFADLREFPPLSSLLWEKLRAFVLQAVTFVPFFVIHRGFVERGRLIAEASAHDANRFDRPESPADQA